MTCAEQIAEFLARVGSKHVFVLTGGACEFMIDAVAAIRRSLIRAFITTNRQRWLPTRCGGRAARSALLWQPPAPARPTSLPGSPVRFSGYWLRNGPGSVSRTTARIRVRRLHRAAAWHSDTGPDSLNRSAQWSGLRSACGPSLASRVKGPAAAGRESHYYPSIESGS
jgi:hypothetical protein